jgi:predicted enzyme related to lactoylglutathione lyase
MLITHGQVFVIPVADQDRARDFSVDVLGFELLQDVEMGPSMRWVQVAPPGSQTSITLANGFESMPPGSLRGTVLETDDLEGDLERFRAKGAVIASGIEEEFWGRFFWITDPDGNGVIIQSTTPR